MSSASHDTGMQVALHDDELALFHRTLAELCRAEVPLPKAFRILQADLREGKFKQAVRELQAEVESGVPLGEAYARQKKRFPPLYCALVEAGMVSGDLPGVLEEISRHSSFRAQVTDRIRRALAYPLITALFVLVLGVVLLVFTAPSFNAVATSIEGKDYGYFTDNLGNSFSHQVAAGALGLLVLGMLAAFVFTWRRGPLDGAAVGGLGFKLPILGRLRLYRAKASFASTMALLLKRGLPLPNALELAAAATEDRALRERVNTMVERARGGAGLADALKTGDVLPPSLLWLVEAGNPEEALEDIAQIYRGRLERAADHFVTLLRPTAELALGIVVFCFAYSYIVPMLEFAVNLMSL